MCYMLPDLYVYTLLIIASYLFLPVEILQRGVLPSIKLLCFTAVQSTTTDENWNVRTLSLAYEDLNGVSVCNVHSPVVIKFLPHSGSKAEHFQTSDVVKPPPMTSPADGE